MFQGLNFEPFKLPEKAESIREEVRAFLDRELDTSQILRSDAAGGASADFSRKVAEQGWVGMTWPKAYGGAERSFLERYVVSEELIASGAPVSLHWAGDRQSGPLLLKYGSEAQKQYFLPKIVKSECFFSIGMSEPDSGSDLASIRTSATKTDGGWILNGSKIWTSSAHLTDYMVTLVRTEPVGENRHAGMSQFLVNLADENVTIRGIKDIAGKRDFNQIFFDDVFLPDNRLVGEPGNGWEQVMSELAYERSGPERFLSAFRLVVEFAREIETNPTDAQLTLLGQIAAQMVTLRRMSLSVAGMLGAGTVPLTEAALIKDVGTAHERMIPELIRLSGLDKPSRRFVDTLDETLLNAPSFTLRGGTREILRGVIARGLGLR